MKELTLHTTRLLEAIELEHRDVQLVVETFAHAESDEVHAVIDRFVLKHGFTGLGERWTELTPDAAFRHVGSLLHKDMAYKNQIMPVARAKELADEVLALVPEARYFSNAEVVDGIIPWDLGSWSWNPITQATFDSGVVMINRECIGIFWVEDED